LIKTSTQEYIEQANAISRALLRMGIKKMIKSPLFHQATGQNGISWILVFYKPSAKRTHIPYNHEDDYEYILNHSGAIYCFVSDEILKK
jgi:long-chain acyl-CoA synthetase